MSALHVDHQIRLDENDDQQRLLAAAGNSEDATTEYNALEIVNATLPFRSEVELTDGYYDKQ